MRSVDRSRRRRRRWFALAALVLAGVVTVAAGGCTAVVRPPASVSAERAVTVWVAKDAMHRGVCLPAASGEGFVEYGYGEWRWYAAQRDAWYRVFPTVLWPTPGTLSRRPLPATDFAMVCERLPWVEFAALRVDRRRMTALRGELDARWQRGLEAAGGSVDERPWRRAFVPSERSYWCLFNCNDAVVAWLRGLDCRVSGGWLLTSLRVAPR